MSIVDSRFAPLFEPMRIGPVTAPNRFYQVPHCSGTGYLRPQMMAAMRGVKAEGGWGVVCTEYCSIDAGADETPYPSASLRDDDDVRNLRVMTDAVHAHGALAGVELWYGGHTSANLLSREAPLDVGSLPNESRHGASQHSQAMDLGDIAAVREMYRAAARRALEAGFDIVYVYACHGYLLHNFLNPEFNQRADAYGGPAANRVRLLREVIEEVGEIITGRAALAVRYAAPQKPSQDPRGTLACLAEIADLPDLWDITIEDYRYEMGSARFVDEGVQREAVAAVRALTKKPLVSVGRYTSPDTMLAQLSSGAQDFIGAARPSIADPFLPRKIAEARFDDIRECIGCNVCYAYDSLGAPIRCTQNPTMGEEWRRGWHPEIIPPRHADQSVLVVGAGPTGLEAARALGQRGYSVLLAEARDLPGGRINLEARLPGQASYARVRDWRLGQIRAMPNLQFYPGNRLDADAIIQLDCQHLVLATGATWRSDGVGRSSSLPIDGHDDDRVLGVERILHGFSPAGRVLIYDDEHYYLGSVLALQLAKQGASVVLVTPANQIAEWCHYTNEQSLMMESLLAAGVETHTARRITGWQDGAARSSCIYGGADQSIAADWLLPVTGRLPNDVLWQQLNARRDEFVSRGGLSLRRAGDCRAPGLIAAAVHDGHRVARETGGPVVAARRERVVL